MLKLIALVALVAVALAAGRLLRLALASRPAPAKTVRMKRCPRCGTHHEPDAPCG